MKHYLWFSFFFLFLFAGFPLSAAEEISVTGGLSIEIPSAAGHSVPAVEYLRRLDRVFRQCARMPTTPRIPPLRLVLSGRQRAGTHQFGRDRNGSTTLTLPSDYAGWKKHPLLGRELVSAILQSRMGNRPDEPLSGHALWIADGLWAEFVQREQDGDRILRYLWLDGLRNVVEADGRIRYSAVTLKAPEVIRPGAADWVLYTEYARLLLDVATHLGGKSNVIQDYVSLLAETSLDPQLAFDRTIGEAAVKRLSYLAPDYAKRLPAERHAASVRALEILSERALFTIHAPLSAQAVHHRLAALLQVPYRRDDGYAATGELADLPLLAEKYESCRDLPRRKIGEINELMVLSPQEFQMAYLTLAAALDHIGSTSTERAAAEIKKCQAALLAKVRRRQQLENALTGWEKRQLPMLYPLRYVLETPPEPEKISNRIDRAMDRAEAEL